MKLIEMAVVAAIFCFVAAAAAYIALDMPGSPASASASHGVSENSLRDNGTQTNVTGGSVASQDASWGCIAGLTTDMDKNGLPNVSVTLWTTRVDAATGDYVNVGLAPVQDNPQVSNGNESANAIGFFAFYNVTPGFYNVTAEKDGQVACGYANVTLGTTTLNVALPGLLSDQSSADISAAVRASDNTTFVSALPRFNPSDDGHPYCTIEGLVRDRTGVSIPGATVTLWTCHPDGASTFANDRVAGADDNPQTSRGNDATVTDGYYAFDRLPYGCYNVTAEKVDAAGMAHEWFAIVNATQSGTYIIDVSIPDLVFRR